MTKEEYKAYQREYQRNRLACETPYDREKRLAYGRQAYRDKLANETEEEREARKEK